MQIITEQSCKIKAELPERDVHKGLLAVREFLDTLDVQKTINIKRDSPEYKQALKEGSPQKFTGLFSTPQNEVV